MSSPAIDRFLAVPRLPLGYFPTPLEELPRLRAALGGGPRLWIKRDDYSGPGFGGNKVRKLEYVLARALADGVQTVLTTGGENSNHARVTAALAARVGLRCILILNRTGWKEKPASLYLDELFGAEIHRVATRPERAEAMRRMAEQCTSRGERVMEIPLGASDALGSLGYVEGVRELAAQAAARGLRFHSLYVSSSSGGTHAGIEVGCQWFGLRESRVIGVSPDLPAGALCEVVAGIIASMEKLIEVGRGELRRTLHADDGFVGAGYAVPTPEAEEAIALLARTEGILLDPVYTAKAMAALLAGVRAGSFREQDEVLFWHTGGQMAMFRA